MREYSCLMLDYKVPEINKIQESIDKNDIYNNEENEYGLETHTHVTLLYGIHKNIKFEELKEHLFPLDEYKTLLVNLSVFENDKYDVLKIDVKCPKMHDSNKKLVDNVDYTNEYPIFKPHITVAYLKVGTGQKYAKKMLDKIIDLTPNNFNYGTFDENENDINEMYYTKDLK